MKTFFYRKTANNTAIIINAKSLSSMRKNIFFNIIKNFDTKHNK